jgi:hypothetical protein
MGGSTVRLIPFEGVDTQEGSPRGVEQRLREGTGKSGGVSGKLPTKDMSIIIRQGKAALQFYTGSKFNAVMLKTLFMSRSTGSLFPSVLFFFRSG